MNDCNGRHDFVPIGDGMQVCRRCQACLVSAHRRWSEDEKRYVVEFAGGIEINPQTGGRIEYDSTGEALKAVALMLGVARPAVRPLVTTSMHGLVGGMRVWRGETDVEADADGSHYVATIEVAGGRIARH